MTTWTPEELTWLTASDSLVLRAGDDEHAEVEIGMIIVHGDLYVRAYRGVQSAWYRAAANQGHGRIRVGNHTRDVLLETHDIGPAEPIDAAYQTKYGRSSALVASPAARSATVRIAPVQP